MALLSFPFARRVSSCRGLWFRAAGVLLTVSLLGQTPNVEYRIKAAYIFNFAKFVTWPSNAFATANAPIVIGIMGKDPFGAEIEQTIDGKSIEGRTLAVKRLADTDSAEGCHILFIASSERKRMGQIIEKLSRTSIVSVGESEGFTDGGGMIQFVQYENNIRFEINVEAAEAAQLKISSKLLQVAIVKGKPRK